MAKFLKSQWSNLFFVGFIILLIIPQTRKPIQVLLNKGLALFGPSIEKSQDRKTITNYNWPLIDSHHGNTFNFNKTEGKVILVNFWATWCPPCIAEMPSLQKLYNDYKDKIEFVFVSEESQETINNFLKEKAYDFDVFIPQKENTEFRINSIPRTFLIDKQGVIIIDKTGAANWNSKVVRETIDALLE